MYKTYNKFEKFLIIVSPFLIIGLIFLFFHSIDNAIDKKRAEIIKEPVTLTYAEDLKRQAYNKKHKEKATPQEIAENIMMKSVGLGKVKDGYSATGISDSDGLFVKQAILNGNAIPYTSNFNEYNSSSNGATKSFDESDQAYWKKVKRDDYQKLKNNAQKQVDDFRNNDKQYQEQEMENNVRKAQYDAKQKGQMKDDKASSSSTVK